MAELPATLSHASTTVPCCQVSLSEKDFRARRADVVTGVSLSVLARVADFGTAPAEGDVVVMDGVTYRVLALSTDPGGLSTTLHLGDQYAEARHQRIGEGL
jgi:hypothetical protein